MPSSIPYQFFLGIALKSSVLLSLTWLAVLLLRLRSAGLRHQAWSVALAATLALPLLSLGLPGLRVPVSESFLMPDFIFGTNAQEAAREPEGSQLKGTPSPRPEPRTTNWGVMLALVWVVGAAVSLSQMLIGWAAMERLRLKANPLRIEGLSGLAKLLEIENEVSLFETERGSMPVTYGVFRPTIFLPADARGWSDDRLRVVLLHELAHVHRRDAATQILARTALSVYWWSPLAWVAWRGFLKEQERAADDLVLRAGPSATEYASHLLEIARLMRSRASLRWAAVAMARPSQLEGRLLAILDSRSDRRTPSRASLIGLSLAAMGIMAPIAAFQAQVATVKAAAAYETNAGAQASGGTTAVLMKAGDEARGQRKFELARELYGKAANAGSGPETATALIDLGEMELQMKEYEKANSAFERAEMADAGKAGEARMWTAIVEQRHNNIEAAEARYQSALAVAEPDSGAAATIMELYAKLLRQQGREDSASNMQNEAAGIRKVQAAKAMAMSQPSSLAVRKIGGDVSAPVLVTKVEPEYTDEARLARYDGTAVLSIEVGTDGIAHNIKVIRALGFGLDHKAVEAVARWRFKPATENGQPVTVTAQVEINFRLL